MPFFEGGVRENQSVMVMPLKQKYGKMRAVPSEISCKRWIILHKWEGENRKASAREGGRDGGWRVGGRGGEEREDGWDQTEHSEQVCDMTACVCVCVSEVAKSLCFGGKWHWRERKRQKESKPEHGCCSLGPLTGTSTLFSNTSRRQPDNSKTLIYTSLHLPIAFSFSVIPLSLILGICYTIYVYVHLLDCILLPACFFVIFFLIYWYLCVCV